MVQGFEMMRTGHDVPQKTSRVVQWRAKGPAGITHDNVGEARTNAKSTTPGTRPAPQWCLIGLTKT
jgi:hypothetical protein